MDAAPDRPDRVSAAGFIRRPLSPIVPMIVGEEVKGSR